MSASNVTLLCRVDSDCGGCVSLSSAVALDPLSRAALNTIKKEAALALNPLCPPSLTLDTLRAIALDSLLPSAHCYTTVAVRWPMCDSVEEV